MRGLCLALTGLLLAKGVYAQDPDRRVADGGIKVEGWKGRVDRRPLAQGRTIADSRVEGVPGGLRMSIGPAAIFWNPANVARGDYEVKATFREHKMTMDHPHSYGIFIGGKDLESDAETLLYCIVYGNGTYAVKTFHGPKVTNLVDREPHEAIRKAGPDGETINEVGWRVQGNKVSCLVNGIEIRSFDKSEVIGPDRLQSTDGVYGIRVSHNVELTVTGLTLTQR